MDSARRDRVAAPRAPLTTSTATSAARHRSACRRATAAGTAAPRPAHIGRPNCRPARRRLAPSSLFQTQLDRGTRNRRLAATLLRLRSLLRGRADLLAQGMVLRETFFRLVDGFVRNAAKLLV